MSIYSENQIVVLGNNYELSSVELSQFAEIIQKDKNNKINLVNAGDDFDVNNLGGSIFNAEILLKTNTSNQDNLFDEILDILLSRNIPKQLGLIVINEGKTFDFLKVFKKAGAKHINFFHNRYPNIGNFKNIVTWYIVYQTKNNIYVGQVQNYFDQELYSKLDTNIPKGRMRNGLINLKLGRILLNLSKNKILWDPFVGSGRLLISGFDKSVTFIASDIQKECVIETKDNWSFISKFAEKNLNSKLSILFQHDLTKRLNLNLSDLKFISKSSIVTEGYLGTNFNKNPNLEDINFQYSELYKLWKNVILNILKPNLIDEIVFCLPFYLNHSKESEKFLIEHIVQLFNNNGYISGFSENDYYLYSRTKTIVAHAIFKFNKTKAQV
jgi:tRNA G10  N-methylase Trm11